MRGVALFVTESKDDDSVDRVGVIRHKGKRIKLS